MSRRPGRGRRLRSAAVVATLVFLASPWGADAVLGAWHRQPPDEAVARPPSLDERPPVSPDSAGAQHGPETVDAQAEQTRPDEEAPPAQVQAETAAPPEAGWRVTNVVDGDTIDVAGADGANERIRLIGMDTPERGACGFAESSDAMTAMALGKELTLSPGAVDDRDRYGRLLRYVDVGGVDAGLALIEQGLAVARYDSRDGYGHHPREGSYVATDAATPHLCSTGTSLSAPLSSARAGHASGAAWASCSEAHAAGAAPVYRDDPGYGRHLDGDGDGVGCE